MRTGLPRLQVLFSLALVVVVSACGEIATSPSPTAMPEPTQPTIAATSEPSSTPAPEVIPGGVKTVTLAADGRVLVCGEVDAATGMALFLDSAGWLYVVDGASLELVTQGQALLPVAEGYAYDLAIDSEAGRIYVADGAREEVLILDAETLSRVGRVDRSGRIAVDPVSQRLYIAQLGVHVADGETGEIIDRLEDTVPEEGMEPFSGVPRGVDVYVNPHNRHLYVMMDNNTPGSNSRHWLNLYDADDYSLLAEYVPSFNWFSDAPAFDLRRRLDYVSGGHPITADRKLVALNVDGREVAHLWGVRGDAFFSPRRDLIYLAGWEELDLVDAHTMNYLDVYPLRVSLHDPVNGRFYDVDWGSENSVTILDEPTVSLGPRKARSEWVGRLPTDEWTAVSDVVLSPSFPDDMTLFAVVGTSLFYSTDGGDNWMEITLPFHIRGTTVEVSLSPVYARDGTLLVGLDCTPVGGGILRSADEGRHWIRANSGLTDLGIADLIFPTGYGDDRTVFARGCFDGVFRSTDGGTTWQAASPRMASEDEQETLHQLVVSPTYAQDQTLWALSSSHLYRSKDAGESWQRADEGLEGLELDKLVLSPGYGTHETALVTAGRGIYVTRNDGGRWEQMELPLEELWVTDLFLSPGFATDGVLFVLGFDGEYLDRLFRSADGGVTWLDVGERIPDAYHTALALSPRYSEDGLVFLVTETGVHRSTDGGEMWQALNLPGASTGSIAFVPDDADSGTVYASLGGGLYRSHDGGDNWSALHEFPPILPTPVASPIPSHTVPPSASPIASPFIDDCLGLDPAFEDIAEWLEVLRMAGDDFLAVGCPMEEARMVEGAWQTFLPVPTVYNLPAYMIWRSDERTVYVIRRLDRLTGRSEAWVYSDTWTEGMPEIPPDCAGLATPDQLEIPVRGFGKIWCDNALYEAIGFAHGSEQGGALLIQDTERGLYLGLPDGTKFAIDVANGLALSQ